MCAGHDRLAVQEQGLKAGRASAFEVRGEIVPDVQHLLALEVRRPEARGNEGRVKDARTRLLEADLWAKRTEARVLECFFLCFYCILVVFNGVEGAWNPKTLRQRLHGYAKTELQHPSLRSTSVASCEQTKKRKWSWRPSIGRMLSKVRDGVFVVTPSTHPAASALCSRGSTSGYTSYVAREPYLRPSTCNTGRSFDST